MKTITERVVAAQSEIQGIKAEQKTQNDSFQFYRYRTDNLYFDSGYKVWRITFCPLVDTPEKVLCQFRKLNDTSPAADASNLTVKISNPLEARFTEIGMGDYNLPSAQRRVYVTCITNCKGYLKVEQII